MKRFPVEHLTFTR